MLANAGSLVGSIAVTSLLGFPYWWLAARTFSVDDVGFAATATSTMTLLGTFGMLGLGTLLIGELSRPDRDHDAFIGSGIAVSAVAGAILGLAFAVFAAAVGLGEGASQPAAVALFTVGVSCTAVTLVVDQALVGLLRGMLQLRRNIIFAASKLVLLGGLAVVTVSSTGVALYATWVVGLALSLVWLALHVLRSGGVARYRPRWAVVRQWRRPALEHHLLNLAIQAPTLAAPLVISATVSVAGAGYYYAAALVTGFLAYGAIALTYALYAIGVRDPSNLAGPLRFTLRLSFAVIAIANVVLLTGANVIMGIFGSDYASNAAGVLRVLALLLFPLVIKDHYIAINRVRGTILTGAKLCLAGGALELAFGAVGALHGGLTWFAWGALIALTLEAVVMAPTLVRELRRPNRAMVSVSE
jgi:O-antigen/teichoic acid export membrane protein